MTIRAVSAIALAGVVMVTAGCHRGGKDELPKGQSVASVDGKDITVYELNAELNGVNLPPGPAQKSAQQAALQQIISRHILADLARDRGLDKTPAYIFQRFRGEQALLAQLLQQSIVARLASPTADEAQHYVDAHPDSYAHRKIMAVDQIAFASPKDPSALKALEPLKTLDEVQAELARQGIQFQRGTASIDGLQIGADALAQLEKLPPHEVFVVPANGGLTANVITGVREEPVANDLAVKQAIRVLQQQRAMQTLDQQLGPEVRKRRASVVYQPGFAPPAPAKGGAPVPKQ